LVGNLAETKRIYLAIDDRTVTLAGIPIHGALAAEKRLLARVDEVVCVSEQLKITLLARLPAERPISIHVVSNGYNEKLFDPGLTYARPLAFGVLAPTARIVLVPGHISDRIDWQGVEAVLPLRPDWTWVFVGPMDEAARPEIEAIYARHGKHRVVILPPAQLTEIPAYIAHSDICAIPYRLNNFTRASSPLKAFEYLAMGSPVLSTRVPSLAAYGNAIEWVDEGRGDSYAAAIDNILGQGNKSREANRRRQLVRQDSWAEKTRLLIRAVCGDTGDDQSYV